MSRLIAALIRHGDYAQLPETPSAHQPFPLTEKGLAQARQSALELRRLLSAQGWDLHPEIDASRLLRAWQTAQVFSDICGAKPDEDNDGQTDKSMAPITSVNSYSELAERSLGSAANLSVTQIESVMAKDPRFEAPPANWKSDSHYCLPLQGAESLMHSGERVAGHLTRQMSSLKTSPSPVVKLFVGHGAAFRHAAYCLGVLDFEDIAKLSMTHAAPVFLEYLPDGSWRHIAGKWKVRAPDSQPID